MEHDIHNYRGMKLGITIALNLMITIGQFIGGIISGSMALLSDALHNLSDVMALVLSYIANRLTGRKNTRTKTFGFKRAEIIAAFINASTLIAIAIYLCIEAIRRFFEEVTISSDLVILFAAASILLNGLSVLILHQDSKHSLNIKSAYLHLFTDMLTSVAVLGGGLAMRFYEVYWVDGVLTLAIAFYLIYSTSKIFTESLKMLMMFTPDSIEIEGIRRRICNLDHVANIHHVHVWQLNDDQIHFEAHIDFNQNLTLEEANHSLEDIRNILKTEFNVQHSTLQPEYNCCDRKELIHQHH